MSGIAVPKPGEINARVNISRLVEDNVIHSAPSFTPGVTVTHNDAVKVFTVNGTSYEYIWSYSYQPAPYTFSHSINDKWATNQLRFTTSLVDGQLKTTTSLAEPNDCGEYALYYLSRYGSWESFLMQGKCRRKDTISGLTLTQECNNQHPYEFGLTNYYSTITPTWELNTGWLTDQQSANFAFNTVSSVMCYLHNLVEGTIFPVVITNNEAEYKQKTRQNRHINYILNVTASQNQHINQ